MVYGLWHVCMAMNPLAASNSCPSVSKRPSAQALEAALSHNHTHTNSVSTHATVILQGITMFDQPAVKKISQQKNGKPSVAVFC